MKPSPTTSVTARWRDRLRGLHHEVRVVGMALVHPGTPRLAKLVALAVVAYAVSPIDLIPDPIPLLGQLDDLILVPLGAALVLRLIPSDVRAECRARASDAVETRSWWRVVGVLMVGIAWLLVLVALGRWLLALWE